MLVVFSHVCHTVGFDGLRWLLLTLLLLACSEWPGAVLLFVRWTELLVAVSALNWLLFHRYGTVGLFADLICYCGTCFLYLLVSSHLLRYCVYFMVYVLVTDTLVTFDFEVCGIFGA